MRDPVEAYFTELRDVRNSGAGVAETSYYGALTTLLDEVGKHLKPRVRAISQLKNVGAGAPDFGLFVRSQFQHAHDAEPMVGQLPQRGVVEVKGTADDAFDWSKWADPDQVPRYVERYGLVLVTNLRDFVLVGRSADGTGVCTLESCRLARTESGFWGRIAEPRKFAQDAAEGLTEFLRRVLLHKAPLADPKDVAWFLASYARTARLRLEQKHELPALDTLRSQLEESLGLKFEGEKGDHFFRSTLVQTLFYGMFASWVLWTRDRDHGQPIDWRDRFQWETATTTLHVPMVYELFRQFADVRQLGALGISEVLEWAEEVLWRVDRHAFFQRFREDHAVQYFYEPFLEAFDPQLRKDFGVWYTPDEVVRYMVGRVDWALREELGIADGLADPSVVVLDPCCGTGAYLVEVLRRIDLTLQAKGADALTRQDVKRAAMERVFGFEIMPAPFVVAHLQLGLLLSELGVPLRDADERAAVYLTNALTGWNRDVAPPKEKRGVPGQMHSTLLFPEFADERDAADRVKREEQILVVIGNPPYNGFAGVAQDEEAKLIEPYKRGLASEWGITKNYLDDLYVRFFRLAERAISSSARGGIACYISSFSWLADPSAVQMRRSILGTFNRVFLDNLNGDSRETGKRTPDGLPDPSVFSGTTGGQGIQVGTAIALLVANPSDGDTAVRYRGFWGSAKRQALATATTAAPEYATLTPSTENRFALRPFRSAEGYPSWPSIAELGAVEPSLGLNENRGGALVDSDADSLRARMKAYFDPAITLEHLPQSLQGLGRAWARFDPAATRAKLLELGGFDESRISPFLSKPFDVEWAYAEPRAKLWNEARANLVRRMGRGTRSLLARSRAPRAMDGAPFLVFSGLADQHALHKDAYLIPLTAAIAPDESLADAADLEPNVSVRAREYLRALGLASDAVNAERLWLHVVAVGYSAVYQVENADAIRADWPRVPLPVAASLLTKSAQLGRTVAGLLDVSPWAHPVETVGVPKLGVLASASGQLDPTCDLGVTARWGIASRNNVIMPSAGRLSERDYAAVELSDITECAEVIGMSCGEAVRLLGDTCFDVYLNDIAYWRCVPSNVWRYTIGGYQVVKKWLSYRDYAVLGRALSSGEARYATEMVSRIAALVLMQPELDANYERVKASVWPWGMA